MNAVAVLIVTCPCALGLAVPVTQVVAAGRLFARGILVKAGDALERLAEIDTVVFDKTGTLSLGQLRLRPEGQTEADIRLAARIALASRHPLSRALAALAPEATPMPDVEEMPGHGLRVRGESGEIRLGSRAWCGADGDGGPDEGPEVWLRHGDGRLVAFRFDDTLRPEAGDTIRRLKAEAAGGVLLLSGDRPGVVRAAALATAPTDFAGGLQPQQKAARVRELSESGRHVLMVGDGINDAPALAFAHASMAPASGAEIAQSRADVVFRGQSLRPVAEALDTARRARRIMLQNFTLALGYNLVAVPLAAAGVVTPLIAAVAMSSSSLLVTLNALRLKLDGGKRREAGA
jgi:Cu2+-exporting ATPase